VNHWGQEDVFRIIAYFHTPSVAISDRQPLDLDAATEHLNERVDEFKRWGSRLAWIDELSVSKIQTVRSGVFCLNSVMDRKQTRSL